MDSAPAPELLAAPAEVALGSSRSLGGLGRRLGRATTVMVGLTLLASIANYASNILFSHLLSPSSYGDLTALLALSVVAGVPTGAAQTMVAERIAVMLQAGAYEEARYLVRHAAAHVGMIAMILGSIYALCAPLIESALSLQTIGPVLALAPLLVLSFFMPIAYGVLQGMERFATLGAIMLVIAASRIVVGVPFVLAGGGAGGPIFGQAVGCLLALLVAAYLLRRYVLGRGTGAARTGLRRLPDRRTLGASGVFIGFALISNGDVLLAKLFLAAHEAGEYAALATVEKMVIFLPGAVAIVMVPSAAKARLVEGSAAGVLRTASALVALTTLLVALPTTLAPGLTLRLMFGSRYVSVAPGVLPIVVAGTGLALLYLVAVYTVAIGDRRPLSLLVGGIVLQAIAIAFIHSSPVRVAQVQAGVVIVVLIANECVFHPLLRAERFLASHPLSHARGGRR